MWESVFRSGVLIQRLTDCDWSIHFWRRAAASMTHLWSMSNAVRYLCFRSAGIRSMSFNSPSKYFKLSIMSRSQRPRALRSLTRNGFRTMNSPDRFDLTKRFLYVGSMQGDVFDAGRRVRNVRNRRRRRDREHVAVAHALGRDLHAQRRPVHPRLARHLDRKAALFLEQLHRVQRQEPALPLRTLVRRIGSALRGEVRARLVGIEGDRLHGLVVELDRLWRRECDALHVKAVR